jgi:hypothetical protein
MRAVLLSALFSGLGFVAPSPAGAVQKATLAWVASADANIIGYRIYRGAASRAYTDVLDVGNVTKATLSGLMEGATYYFAVTAYDSSGLESPASNEASYEVPRPATGTYHGLFYGSGGVVLNQAGGFTFSVTARGAYSGRLLLGSQRSSFSGRLNPQHQAANTIHLPDGRQVNVQLDAGMVEDADGISGSVTGETWVSNLSGDRVVYGNARQAPYAGRYTFIVPGREDDPAVPGGDGYGTIRVSDRGLVRFAGRLADGAKLSQSVPLSGGGRWPLYGSLYSGQGLVLSWMTFTNDRNSDLHGALSWIKSPNPQARYYPGGFTHECLAAGSMYTAPADALGSMLDLTAARLTITGGNLVAGVTNSVVLEPNGKVSHQDGLNLALTFSPSTGAFKGKAADPITGRWLPFGGAVMQRRNAGYGFLLGTSQSSRVALAQ